MTAKDRWTVDLSCNPCGTRGEANVSHEDGIFEPHAASFANWRESFIFNKRPAALIHARKIWDATGRLHI